MNDSSNSAFGEILVPVADFEMCRAAVHGGADAIYLGAPYFNARGRAPDLSEDALRELIDFCHLHNVKVFAALNILLFESELRKMPDYLENLIGQGIDALIVQDIGLVRLVRQIAPQMRIHASTQMTVSSAEAIALVEDLKIERYVLAREMSLSEIQAVRDQSQAELEVFVHGALCVSYSGQCLTSESFGGRSANRGQCAQSCRMEYTLIVDGKAQDLNGQKYLFSPKDLCGLQEIPLLQKMGVESFKIEGRLKGPAYAAATAKAYQKVRDGVPVQEVDTEELAAAYSRGFYSGWLHGVQHQELVDGWTSSHVGLEIGILTKVQARSIFVKAMRSTVVLQAGDGIYLLESRTGRQIGSRIWSLETMHRGQEMIWRIELAPETAKDLAKVSEQGSLGTWRVWRNDAPGIEKELRQIWTDKAKRRRIGMKILAQGKPGAPLTLNMFVGNQQSYHVRSAEALSPAANKPLDYTRLFEELSALAEFPLRLDHLDWEIEGDVFCPPKELRALRRQLCEQWAQDQKSLKTPQVTVEKARFPEPQGHWDASALAQLHVLIRHESQITALEGLDLGSVTMDFEWGKDYKPGLEKLRSMGFKTGIASLRIHKPGENHHLKLIEKLRPDFVLVRNLGALQWLQDKEIPLIGDFGLNICNSLSWEYFGQKNLLRLQPGHDLNATQLSDLLRAIGPGEAQKCEISIHLYMSTFHMEHCVFAAFMSNGSSWKDCGKPCEKHRVEVMDPKGEKHYLKPDQECRNTLFYGSPQSAAKLIPELKDLGLRHFRLEALDENPQDLRHKVQTYLQAIHGEIDSKQVFESIGVVEKYGVTEGQLFVDTRWQDRKKEARR